MSRSTAPPSPVSASASSAPPPRRSRPERQLDQWQSLFDSQFSREETDCVSRQLARMAVGHAAQAHTQPMPRPPMRMQRRAPSYDIEGRLEADSEFALSAALPEPELPALPAASPFLAAPRDRRRPLRMHFIIRQTEAETEEDSEAGKILLESEIAARAQRQQQQQSTPAPAMQAQTAEHLSAALVAAAAIAAVAAVAIAVAAEEPSPVPARALPVDDDSHARSAAAPPQDLVTDAAEEPQMLQPQHPVDNSTVPSDNIAADPIPQPRLSVSAVIDDSHLDDFSIEHDEDEEEVSPLPVAVPGVAAAASAVPHHQHAASCMTGAPSAAAARSAATSSPAGSPHAHSLSMGSDAAFSALDTHSPRAAAASVDSGLPFVAASAEPVVSASSSGSDSSDKATEQLLASLRAEPQDIALYGWNRDPELEASSAPTAVAVREAEAELMDLTQKPDSMQRLLATPLRAHALLKFYGTQLKPLPSSARRTALNSLVAQAFATTSNNAAAAKGSSKSPTNATSSSNTRQTRFASMGDVVEAAVADSKGSSAATSPTAASTATAASATPAAASSAPVAPSPLGSSGWAHGSSTSDPKAILGYLMQLEDYASASSAPTQPQQSDDDEEGEEKKSMGAAPATASAPAVAPSAAAAVAAVPADSEHDHGEWHAESGDESSRSHTNAPSSPASPAASAAAGASPPLDSLPPPALSLSRAPSSQSQSEKAPFVPFAPYSLATRNHILAYLDILEYRSVWNTFAAASASSSVAAAASKGSSNTSANEATAASASSSSDAATATEGQVATFTVGHGLRSLSGLLTRIQNSYLRPGAKSSLGFSSAIVRPIEAAIEEFLLAAAAALQGPQMQSTAAASSPSSAAQQAALEVPSSPRTSSLSTPAQPSPRAAAAAATAAPSLPLGLFDPLSQRLLQRLEQVLWAHYTAPAQNVAALASAAGSSAPPVPASATGPAADYSYVAAFHATRIRLLQRLSKLLVSLHVQRRPAVMQDLWQGNAVLHQWTPRAAAEGGAQIVTTRLQRQPSFLASKAPAASASVVVPPPLSASAAAATVAAASAVSISARDQLVLLKLLNQSFTIPFLKSWLQGLQAMEDKLHAAQEKVREQAQRAEQQREREAIEAHDGDWSIPDEDEVPSTSGGLSSRRASSAAASPAAPAPPALPARRYPHTCFVFWMEVQAFRRCPRSEFRRRWARKLYQNYIAPPATPANGTASAAASSSQPVIQLPNSIKRSIARACLGEHPPSATFLAAQSLAFTVLASYFPLLHLAPAYPEMIAKIEAFNAKFLEGLDENLRGLFAPSGGASSGGSNAGGASAGGAGADDDVFALLSAADDSTVASSSATSSSSGASIQFEDVLSGRGLLYFHQFLLASAPAHTDGDLSGLLFWLEVQEYQRLPPGSAAQDFLAKSAAKLYETYLRGAAAGEMVVLSGAPVPGIREAIVRSLERPSPLLFNAAQRCVEEWLREESFVRFASSDFATAMKEEWAARSKSAEAAEREQRIAFLRRKSAMSSMDSAAVAAANGGASSAGGSSPSSAGANKSASFSSASSSSLLGASSSHVSPTSLASSFGLHPPVLLFSDLLADAQLLGLFKEYLSANFALESWMAWEDIQGYKTQPASDFRVRNARKIYAKYFKDDAKMKITYLGDTVAAEIRTAMAASTASTSGGGSGGGGGGVGPSATIFAAAESVLFEYLSIQAYSGFLASRQFSELPAEYLANVVAQNEAREREEAERIAMEDAAWEIAEAHAQHAQQDQGSNGAQNGHQSQRSGGAGHKDSVGSASDSNRRDSSVPGGGGGALGSLGVVSVNNAPRLTPAELRAKQVTMWESVTLELVLDDPCALARFKHFSLRMRCAENLLFYLACEEFRYIPSSSYLRVVANKIVQTYIRNAKQQVNLPGWIVREIEENLAACSTNAGGAAGSSSSGVGPSKKLFLSASTAIFRLMAADTFPRFLSSPEYRAFFEVDLPSRLISQSRWQKIKNGDLSGAAAGSGSAAVLPPRGTIIAPIRSTLSSKAMALSWIDSEGEARMSLFGRPSAAAALAHKQAMAEVTKAQRAAPSSGGNVRRMSAQRLQPIAGAGSSTPVVAAQLLPSNAAISMAAASKPTTYRLSYVGAAGLGLPAQTSQSADAAVSANPVPARKGSTIAEGDVTLEIDEDE